MQKSPALFLPSVEMPRGIVQAARPTHPHCTARPSERRPAQIYDFKRETGWRDGRRQFLLGKSQFAQDCVVGLGGLELPNPFVV